jgi:hypothetical protein
VNDKRGFGKRSSRKKTVALISRRLDASGLHCRKNTCEVLACLPVIPMQIHWGNLGSAAAGFAALIAALFGIGYALHQGPAWLRDIRSRQQAQTEAANNQAVLAHEEAEQILLDRRRLLHGWSRGSLATFNVVLVSSEADLTRARIELKSGAPTAYVVLRVAEGPGDENRALHLRQIINEDGSISRSPTTGEREALEAGLTMLLNPE